MKNIFLSAGVNWIIRGYEQEAGSLWTESGSEQRCQHRQAQQGLPIQDHHQRSYNGERLPQELVSGTGRASCLQHNENYFQSFHRKIFHNQITKLSSVSCAHQTTLIHFEC